MHAENAEFSRSKKNKCEENEYISEANWIFYHTLGQYMQWQRTDGCTWLLGRIQLLYSYKLHSHFCIWPTHSHFSIIISSFFFSLHAFMCVLRSALSLFAIVSASFHILHTICMESSIESITYILVYPGQ